MPVQKKDGKDKKEGSDKKNDSDKNTDRGDTKIVRDNTDPVKPLRFKKLTPAEESEYKGIEAIMDKIGAIFDSINETRSGSYSIPNEVDKLVFRLGMFYSFLMEGEINNEINVHPKLKADNRVQTSLSELNSELHGKRVSGKVDIDEVVAKLKGLSNALGRHIQLEVEEEPSKPPKSPKGGSSRSG